jgi:hypothetical protein
VLFLGEPLGLSAEQIAGALDPTACVARRTATGAPGEAEMRRQIAASCARLARDAEEVQARRDQIARAEQQLEKAIAALHA